MKNSIKNWAAALLWLAASSLPLYAQDVSTDTLSEEPLSLPFVEYFDKEESLANWTIRDSAGNILEDASGYMQWQDSRGVGETPYLHYQSLYSGKQAYLVSAPMDIAMGKAYLSLFITVGFQGNGQILYGSSSNPQEMEILQEIAYENLEFKHILCQFEASGEPLYFAFLNNGNFIIPFLSIDAIEIGQGEYEPHPRCQILEMELPASGYDLDFYSPLTISPVARSSSEPLALWGTLKMPNMTMAAASTTQRVQERSPERLAGLLPCMAALPVADSKGAVSSIGLPPCFITSFLLSISETAGSVIGIAPLSCRGFFLGKNDNTTAIRKAKTAIKVLLSVKSPPIGNPAQ